MKKILPFSSSASAHGFRHTLLGWHRRLTNQKQNRFVEAMVARGLPVEPLQTGDVRFRTCPLCGYAIASVTNVSGWNIQACSTLLLSKMIESAGFDPWFNQVAGGSPRNPEQNRSRRLICNLQDTD